MKEELKKIIKEAIKEMIEEIGPIPVIETRPTSTIFYNNKKIS